MTYNALYQERKNCVEDWLRHWFDSNKQTPVTLYEAMEYSLLAGGKRLRPVLLLSVCEDFGGKREEALPFASALEMIHTYSLIHDDLPAMDNDDLRRGKPTCHKQFGEALAILAGDALLHTAVQIMTEQVAQHPEAKFSKAMLKIVEASGINGMIGGQVVDVQQEGKEIDPETLLFIHTHKTAALIQGAIAAGGLLGEADAYHQQRLEEAGEALGIAFQITDDILDLTGKEQELGKPIQSDEKNNKNTAVSVFGLQEARSLGEKYTTNATRLLIDLGKPGEFLSETARQLETRRA